jgi:hypothetical protein
MAAAAAGPAVDRNAALNPLDAAEVRSAAADSLVTTSSTQHNDDSCMMSFQQDHSNPINVLQAP